MKYAFAGNREIAYNVLEFMLKEGYKPSALMIPDNSSIANKIIELSGLDQGLIYIGKDFKTEKAIQALKDMDLDYIIGIHFPLIIPQEVLQIPKIGFINLHPAYLPYNKGWHTPSWAILDASPYGATLHFMTQELDQGDIIHQQQIEVTAADTANELYAKVLQLEETVFESAFPLLTSLNPPRKVQNRDEGKIHFKKDLQAVQKINLDDEVIFRDAIDKLRGLTTSDIKEASYFESEGKKYAIQIKIQEIE